jgi:hypothetical protein|tara:strand:+ start:703 stop:888 length:186 start_codon:yes stop_codon:yes gene_type:complete
MMIEQELVVSDVIKQNTNGAQTEIRMQGLGVQVQVTYHNDCRACLDDKWKLTLERMTREGE